MMHQQQSGPSRLCPPPCCYQPSPPTVGSPFGRQVHVRPSPHRWVEAQAWEQLWKSREHPLIEASLALALLPCPCLWMELAVAPATLLRSACCCLPNREEAQGTSLLLALLVDHEVSTNFVAQRPCRPEIQ